MKAKAKVIKVLSAEWATNPEVLHERESREACEQCGLYKFCKTPYSYPGIPRKWTGRLLCIGEAFGKHEDEVSGRPFTGDAGRIIRSLLSRSGFSDDDVGFVNAVRCRPRGNATPSMKQIRACRPFVLQVIKEAKPKILMGLGGTALKTILNRGGQSKIADFRGRRLLVDGLDVHAYVTYHPASILHGNLDHEDRILEDLQRLNKKALPWPKNGKLKFGENVIGFDTEYKDDQVLNVCAANEKVTQEMLKPLDFRQMFTNKILAGHHITGDVSSLFRMGCVREDWAKGENLIDSFILARLENENRGKGNYNVETLLLSLYNTAAWKHKTEDISEDNPFLWPAELRSERCRLDAWGSYLIARELWKGHKGPLSLHTKIAMTLHRAWLAGAYIDVPFYQKWANTQERHLQQAQDILTKLAWKHGIKDFTPKPEAFRTLIYKKLKLRVEERTAKENLPAVTKAVLLEHRDQHKEVKAIHDWVTINKLCSTYARGMQSKLVDLPDGKGLRFRLGVMGARTGRRASDKPNAQNWPKEFRQIVCSRFKDGVIVDNDFSKLEIILLAWEAGDEKLMDYFTKNENGYIAIGEDLFDKTVKEGTSDYRLVKSNVLGTNYRMGAFKMAKQLWQLLGVRLSPQWEDHLEQVENIRARYLRMFPHVSAYQRDRVEEVHNTGEVKLWFNQRRRLPIPSEPPRSERQAWKTWRKHVSHIENEAVNAPIQNAASFVCGTAMLDVEENLLSQYDLTYRSYHTALLLGKAKDLNMPLLINEVHDDLVYDVPAKHQKRDLRIIKETMQELKTLRRMKPEFDAPIRVDQKAASHWCAKEG